MRRAVVAPRKRCPLAGLALPGGGMAAGDSAVEKTRLHLLLDERRRSPDAFAYRPRDLSLRGDGEVTPDVGEERSVGTSEVVRILRQSRHRALTLRQHCTPEAELLSTGRVRVDEVLDRTIDRSRVLIHTGAKLSCVIVHGTYAISPISVLQGEKEATSTPRQKSVAPFEPCYKVGTRRRRTGQRSVRGRRVARRQSATHGARSRERSSPRPPTSRCPRTRSSSRGAGWRSARSRGHRPAGGHADVQPARV